MSVTETAASLRELAEQSNAWPFEEARKIVARLKKTPKDEVIFETGYGPSGLPHIGTFGEVARTTMVRHAFRVLTDDKIKTRLIAFSDDMDGLRKVPDNVPNKEMLAQHLGKPLTKVPDPFGTHPSFGEHNNARLRAFLDTFGFEYEFMSSTRVLHVRPLRRDAAQGAGALRRGDGRSCCRRCARSARRPIRRSCRSIRSTGIVLQVPVTGARRQGAAPSPTRIRTPRSAVTDAGHRRPLQAAMEAGLGDALGRARHRLRDGRQGPDRFGEALAAKSAARSAAAPPEGFNYELFLDEKGQKISKSKGNGLTIDEWLRYASPGEPVAVHVSRAEVGEAALLRRHPAPRRRLPAVPRRLRAAGRQAAPVQSGLAHPFRQAAEGRHADLVHDAADAGVVVERRERRDAVGLHRPLPARRDAADASEAQRRGRLRHPLFPRLRAAGKEIPRAERGRAQGAARSARRAVAICRPTRPPRQIQDVVYEIGRREPFLDEKKKAKDGKPGVSLDWFNMLYQVLLGQEKGPRFGSFVAVYGLKNTVDMIDGALARSA